MSYRLRLNIFKFFTVMLLVGMALYLFLPDHITDKFDERFFPAKTYEGGISTKAEAEPRDRSFQGKVNFVYDGDTVEVTSGNFIFKIRLEYIDAPEKGQPYANKSKNTLRNMIGGSTVTVDWDGEIDNFGRYVAVIIDKDNRNINKEMVKQGMAWYFSRYARDTSYSQLEAEARERKAGLWKDAEPVAPWDYRDGF